jgi:hypothetical protein
MAEQPTSKKTSGTVIAPCACEHAYQDEKYGKHNRVWNRGGSAGKESRRCMVCGNKVNG